MLAHLTNHENGIPNEGRKHFNRYPTSLFGKIVGCFAMYFGLFGLAMPLAIISLNIKRAQDRRNDAIMTERFRCREWCC